MSPGSINNIFDITAVIPCFNEEDNIAALVEKVQQAFSTHSINGEIILVNDASLDGTQRQIDIAMQKYNNIRSFGHKKNKGIFKSWITGARNASGRYVVILDADLQYDPDDIPVLYNEIQKNKCDIVQGWRKNYSDTRFRYILSVGFSKLLGVFFKCRLQDIKSGFLICRKEVFMDILSYKLEYMFPQHYLTLSGISKKYKIDQIPVTFRKRLSGNSYITSPFLFSLKAFWELPKAFYEFRVLSRKKGR
ncbi:MAG: glycosyltransferase family 2 protein [Nitrospirae bacterium]|nr:glycosyltransferase family 2 protein [Nitrospirota bacterium]